MIKSLRIRNLATIEDIELGFENGFTILTGETGTGKSIIIGGLKLVLGEKGSSDIIRTGELETSVEAIFQIEDRNPPGKKNLKDGLKELFIHRKITGKGQGKSYFDGTLVPAKKLKEWGEILVNIYGQNDHVFLRQLEFQLDYFDHSASVMPIRNQVTKLAQDIRRLRKEKQNLVDREKERAMRQDYLEFQINEIESANLSDHEEKNLRQERNILKNAEQIRELVADAMDIACGQENSLSPQLARLRNITSKLVDFGSEFKDIEEGISQFTLVLNEFNDFLIKFQEKHETSAFNLETIEERLNTIEKLKRKYGASIKDILSSLERAKNELLELESNQERLSELNRTLESKFQEYRKLTAVLSKKRQAHAPKLDGKIKNEITILGMKKADFSVNLHASFPEVANFESVRDRGTEEVEFLISPNPGEELRPLRKIASGGELSRIMLALKSIGTDLDKNRTLIFDEIDAGIGGKTAELVAKKLRDLSQNSQVICITHLPQIASFAHQHFKIEKGITQDRTFTTVKKLDFQERIEEISRLLAGSRITAATRQSAREMLEHNQP